MRFWLEIQYREGVEVREVKPLKDEPVGVAEGECPGCSAEPFRVQGGGVESYGIDTVHSGGRCTSCGDPVGWIYGRHDTIFGEEEDRFMLDPETRGSRARIYR